MWNFLTGFAKGRAMLSYSKSDTYLENMLGTAGTHNLLETAIQQFSLDLSTYREPSVEPFLPKRKHY